MKKVILFGTGANGKKIMDTYLDRFRKEELDFEIVAAADNDTKLTDYRGIQVISPQELADRTTNDNKDNSGDISFDEIWICTVYYRSIWEQLTKKLAVNPACIRYVEYPSMFLEKQIRERYQNLPAVKTVENDGDHDTDHDTDMKSAAVLERVAVHGLRMYCYPFYEEYMRKDLPVFFDETYGLYYGIYKGRRMYLSGAYDTGPKAEHYFRYACMEQDYRSPHCYLSGFFDVGTGGTGVDIGAAEGIFTLGVLDRIRHMYVIEADPDWCRALEITFKEETDKVTVIRGFVSDTQKDGHLVLDQLFADRDVDFIKMDIEGAEPAALRGAEALVRNCHPALAICTYHHPDDYGKISGWITKQGGYRLKSSPGYVVCQGEWELDHPEQAGFRKALLWAKWDIQKEYTVKKLAACIPNYNRPEKLKRLLEHLAAQIVSDDLADRVEICVSDDCSTEKPDEVIRQIRETYPQVTIRFSVNEKNRGMDYNFLRSVMRSEAEYCWIIGNDDLPESHALSGILYLLDHAEKEIDVLVSPFDLYDAQDRVCGSVKPLMGDITDTLYFDTGKQTEYDGLLDLVTDGNALFCFLSNVVFKKSGWVSHGNMFENKMNTIFIQMYMNLQTLKEGAVYAYTPVKFIKNYGDDAVNATFRREYDVLTGLYGVIDYFFTGKRRRSLQRRITDPRINGRMWELPEDSPLKEAVRQMDSPKTLIYQKYFIRPEHRKRFFAQKHVRVYGAGTMGRRAVRELEQYGVASLSVYDADPHKAGTAPDGYEIKPAEMIYADCGQEPYTVVVTVQYDMTEIVTMLLEHGVIHIAVIN